MRKLLSALLLGLGTATSFIGVLALLLSQTQNHQLRLIAASFDVPSRFGLVNVVNAMFRFSLDQSAQVLGVGLLVAIVGGYLVARFDGSKKRYKRR